jgi:hypothetical protein
LVLDDFFVKEAFSDFFLENGVFLFGLFHDCAIVIVFLDSLKKLTFHKGLVFSGDLFGGNAIHAIGIISNSNEQRT